MMVAVIFCCEFFFFLFYTEAKVIVFATLCFPSFKVTSAEKCHTKSFRNPQLEIN